MSSYKDITTFSTPMLVKSLDTLEISAGEDNGKWGSQFPQGVAIFVGQVLGSGVSVFESGVSFMAVV